MPSIAFVIKNQRGFRAIAGITCHVENVPGLSVEMTHGCVYTKVLAEAQEHVQQTGTDLKYLSPVEFDEDDESSVGIITLALIEEAQKL